MDSEPFGKTPNGKKKRLEPCKPSHSHNRAMPKQDPAVAKLLADAQDPKAQELTALHDALIAAFRVSVGGVDLTEAARRGVKRSPELQAWLKKRDGRKKR